MDKQEKIDLWRRRFYGRQTAFGKRENGGPYSPVFKNASSMHGPERYKPLEDSDVAKHLDGLWDLLIYLLHESEMVKFCVLDFDTKHTFKDVLVAKNAIVAAGIPCAIARSTKKGYHIYLFFDEMIKPMYVISFFAHLYEDIGFAQLNREGIKPLPETFPKTTHLGDSAAVGLGIKPPMQGKGMSLGQNCWVDDENHAIGGKGDADEQWDYFKAIPDVVAKDLISLLIKKGIPILEDMRISESRGVVDDRPRGRLTPYVPPEKGDFELIVNQCPALKELWLNAESAGHDARTGILSFAMHTKNGFEILRKRWPSEKTEYFLEYAANKNYRPWSCSKMQSMSLCVKGKHPTKSSEQAQIVNGEILNDYCLEKTAPREMINGKWVITNTPEKDWALPSPIRYAFGGKRPKAERAAESPEEVPPASASVEEEERATVTFGTNIYSLLGQGVGYFRRSTSEEGANSQLCDFTVDIVKMICLTKAKGGIDVILHGRFYSTELSSDFEISDKDWHNNPKFLSLLGIQLHGKVMIETKNLDHIRNCISAFGMDHIVKEYKVEDYGFNNPPTYYAATNCTITAEKIDTENILLSLGRGPSEVLWLTPLSDEEFTEACNLLFEDVLTFQNPRITRTVVAHSLQALIQNAFLPLEFAPVVWLQGLTGTGKSTLAKIAQFFHTDKTNIMLNVNSTVRALEENTMLFKDSLMVIDDYRGESMQATAQLIQKLYDRSGRVRLQGGSKMGTDYKSEATKNRGLTLFTGEDIMRLDAAVLSRCIVLEFTHNTEKGSAAKLARIFENKRLLSGISARFIQYMLRNQPDKAVIQRKYGDYSSLLKRSSSSDAKKVQNAERMAVNLAANALTLDLFLDFLQSEGFIGASAASEIATDHWKYLEELNGKMQRMCMDEQASTVFIERLKELLSSGRYVLEGYHNMSLMRGATNTLGFIDGTSKDLEVRTGYVFLHPNNCYEAVKKMITASGQPFSLTVQAIGKQLNDDGHLMQTDLGRNQLSKSFGSKTHKVWCVKRELLGMLSILDGDAEQENDAEDSAKDDRLDPSTI